MLIYLIWRKYDVRQNGLRKNHRKSIFDRMLISLHSFLISLISRVRNTILIFILSTYVSVNTCRIASSNAGQKIEFNRIDLIEGVLKVKYSVGTIYLWPLFFRRIEVKNKCNTNKVFPAWLITTSQIRTRSKIYIRIKIESLIDIRSIFFCKLSSCYG